jgi:type II secretory pathway predicted ATPase ExeA
LIIVDEAQNLPVSALEELRMLSNFQLAGRALVQILLLGQPEFRDRIAAPGLEQLRQR